MHPIYFEGYTGPAISELDQLFPLVLRFEGYTGPAISELDQLFPLVIRA